MAYPVVKTPASCGAASRGAPISSLLLGTGLTLASLILIPALAQHLGMGAGLTGALRVAAMRASRQV